MAKEGWLNNRKAELLPVPYFHLVFTLPHELNPLILCNMEALLSVQIANWQNNAEIKERFSTVSILNATRIVFNIGGNKFRLICIVRFDKQIIFIRFIGTHKEYDNINAAEV